MKSTYLVKQSTTTKILALTSKRDEPMIKSKYLFPLLIGNSMRLEKTRIGNGFHLMELTNVIFPHKFLNIRLHFLSIKLIVYVLVTFLEHG
jgi:hypothetical protein